jgi:hypothetical protein
MTTAPASGFPLPLRNALARTTIAALDDATAEEALDWLAAGGAGAAPAGIRERLRAEHLVEADGTLLDVHRPHLDRIREHAGRARRAAKAHRARPTRPEGGRLTAAADRAIALWNAELFFEVHEVLEAEWQQSSGAERGALQGVIQIAVALHHHRYGNARGARALMREGRERLAATHHALRCFDGPALLRATAAWESAFATGSAPPDATPPRLARAPET